MFELIAGIGLVGLGLAVFLVFGLVLMVLKLGIGLLKGVIGLAVGLVVGGIILAVVLPIGVILLPLLIVAAVGARLLTPIILLAKLVF